MKRRSSGWEGSCPTRARKMRITLWIVRGCDLLLVLIIVCFFLNRCGTITKTGMTRASLLRDTREAVVRYLGRPCDDDDSDDVLAIHRLFPRNLAGGPRWSHKTGYNTASRWKGTKKVRNSACTAESVRKGTILTSCGIPSRFTCNQIIPGT